MPDEVKGAGRLRPHYLLAAAVFLLLAAAATLTSAHGAAAYSRQSAGLEGATSTPSTCDWTLRSSPNVDVYNSLDALAPVAADDVWAVGASGPDDPSQATLIEHWDGASWSVVSSPSPGDREDRLPAAAALSATDIWAVGEYNGDVGGTSRSLILHWDGNAWAQIPSPNPAVLRNDLFGIAPVSPSDIWALGTGWSAGQPRFPIILHWDGTNWNSVDYQGAGSIAAATAISPTNVWAVGNLNDNLGHSETFVLRWDGNSWSMVSSPNVAGVNNYLNGVTAISANDVWAVGVTCTTVCDGGSTTRPLTMHWDGTAWSIVPTPDLQEYSALHGVAAVSSADVWAVGEYTDGIQGGDLRLHWDGAAWSIFPGQDPQSCCPQLHAVAVVPGGDLWAAGLYHFLGNPVIRTQAEHLPACITGTVTPSPPSATSTATPTNAPTTTPTAVGTSATTATTTPLITPSATGTPCSIDFGDVHPADYFYAAVAYLYCQGAISGYSDGTFRPYNNTTRGQLSKIVVLAEGWPIVTPTGTTSFTDVPATNPFYPYVETAASHGIISGYADGTFRPGNDVTRGQLCKIVVLAQGWALQNPPTPTFSDVPATNPFFAYIETALSHGIISGYADATFRPGNSATRGQISKIVYLAVIGPNKKGR